MNTRPLCEGGHCPLQWQIWRERGREGQGPLDWWQAGVQVEEGYLGARACWAATARLSFTPEAAAVSLVPWH